MERAMKRLLIFAAILALMPLVSAQAQTGNSPASSMAPGSIAGASGAPAGETSSRDPALDLQGMPCSVSSNATGGVTTSSSCGNDPLGVSTSTLASPAQAGNTASTAAAAAQTSGGGTTATAQGGSAAQTTGTASS